MFLPWLTFRVMLPLAITAVVTYLTWGKPFFDVDLPLLWATFVVHLLVTIGFKQTHVLDTGSFFCLLFCFAALADISEAYGSGGMGRWGIAAAAFAGYMLLSYVGRYRASQSGAIHPHSVSPFQILVGVVLLTVGVVVCSTSKTAVGFLLVPPIIGVPVLLIYSLLNRDQPKRNDGEKG